ncbi:unnamed protein product, partial [Ectocarpus sp. 13 AM-2016]
RCCFFRWGVFLTKGCVLLHSRAIDGWARKTEGNLLLVPSSGLGGCLWVASACLDPDVVAVRVLFRARQSRCSLCYRCWASSISLLLLHGGGNPICYAHTVDLGGGRS